MQILRPALLGVGAGTAGVAALTLTNEIEQALTGRPDSYVPARTLEGVLGLSEPRDPRTSWLHNHAWHWGHGAAVGALRGVMAQAGLHGPWASALFGVCRLTSDQLFENATAAGAPIWTFPRSEIVVDLVHKTAYALAAGAVADRLVRPR